MEFISKIAISKGWSDDKKYCVTDQNQQKYFLRISDKEKLDSKKFEFDMMEKVASLGVPMCKPISIELCDDAVHSLHEWIDGRDARETILTYSENQQYTYGIETGRLLRKIHTIPATEVYEDWEIFFNRKIDDKISKYKECPVQYESGHVFIDFLNENRELLKNRPQVLQHGDYHIGNFMIGEDREIYVIDFDRFDVGDPWEEFNRIVWSAQVSPAFASGMIDGYFDDKVPDLFWKLLAVYILSNLIGALPWAIPYGEEEVSVMQNQAKKILEWYDDMKQIIPSWYLIDKKTEE
ncbi:aminoglycoside phosphotransferase family protein [Streptococcus oralis]|uniref:aminoglycoside phosphotransferase family protein n=1 Tax=Streptococcus oralis TaxID=1303 RepID=UPI00280B38AB|nr:phosphotransferase [uncultured Streptococcus sp.]